MDADAQQPPVPLKGRQGVLPSYNNESWSLAYIVRTQLVIAKHLLYLDFLIGQHLGKIAQAELGHLLGKLERLFQRRVLHNDALEKMRVVVPAVYFIAGVLHRFRLVVHKVVLGIMHIQIIKQDGAFRIKVLCKGPHRIVVLAAGAEIPKGGKEVKNVIEIIDPGRQAHVLLIKMQVIRLKLFGKCDAVQREVNACDIKAFGSQDAGMPAAAATGIEHAAVGGRLQKIEQVVNKVFRFGIIVVEIELVIIR